MERYGPRGAAMVLDLDHFKTINDTLGHGVGDELITRVAPALRVRLRASDVLARLGGDEFAVLLPEGGREEAAEVAEDVLAPCAARPCSPAPATRAASRRASASRCWSRAAASRPTPCSSSADLAMYEAKEGAATASPSPTAGLETATSARASRGRT